MGLAAAILLVCLGYPIAVDQYHIHRLQDEAHWRASADALIERRSTRGLADVVRAVFERDVERLGKWQNRIYLQFGRDERYALPAYSEALLEGDEYRQQTCLEGIRRFGRRLPGVAKLLGEGLERVGPDFRWQCAWLLASLGPVSEPAIPVLLNALEDDDKKLRYCAVRALSMQSRQTPAVVDGLIRASRDQELTVACFAIEGLAALRDPKAAARVRELLATRDARLAHALRGQNRSREISPELAKRARDILRQDQSLSTPYFEQRIETGDALIEGFPLQFMSSYTGATAGTTGTSTGYDDAASGAFMDLLPLEQLSPSDWQVFLAALRSPSPTRKIAALGLSVAVESPRDETLRERFAAALLEQLGDASTNFWENLPCNAVALMAVIRHGDLLLPKLRAELDGASPRRRVGAIFALGCLQDTESLPKLRAILDQKPTKPPGRLGGFMREDIARPRKARVAAAFAVRCLDATRNVVPEILESIREAAGNFECEVDVTYSGLPPFIALVTEVVGGEAAASVATLTEHLNDVRTPAVVRHTAARLLIQAGLLDPVRRAIAKDPSLSKVAGLLLAKSPKRTAQDVVALVEYCLAAESAFGSGTYTGKLAQRIRALRPFGPVAKPALEPLLRSLEAIDFDTCVKHQNLRISGDGRREEASAIVETLAAIGPDDARVQSLLVRKLRKARTTWAKL
ncbi:MAG: HEAT repeat domain-containing protein, partial [Planctomycetota bacterium]